LTLQVLAVMKKKSRPLSELAAVMSTLPQVLVNVTVERRRELDSIPVIGKAIADAEKSSPERGASWCASRAPRPSAGS